MKNIELPEKEGWAIRGSHYDTLQSEPVGFDWLISHLQLMQVPPVVSKQDNIQNKAYTYMDTH